MNKRNMTVQKGETLLLTLSFQDPDEQPLDLTGHSLTLRVWDEEGDLGEGSADGDDTGTVDLRITDEATHLWDTGVFTYRVEHEQPNGDLFFPVGGLLTVEDL